MTTLFLDGDSDTYTAIGITGLADTSDWPSHLVNMRPSRVKGWQVEKREVGIRVEKEHRGSSMVFATHWAGGKVVGS